MEAKIAFDPKFKFPTKASMKPGLKIKKVDVISNHFVVEPKKPNFIFNEWFISFIKKSDYQQFLKNKGSVAADAISSDARYLIQMVWKKNRQAIEQKIGRHLVTGVTLYSCQPSEDTYLHFAEHSEYVIILELKNTNSSLDQMMIGENKQTLLRFLNTNLKQKLIKSNFVEIGANKKYYNSEWTKRVSTGDFAYLVYRGYKTAYDIYEGGLRLLVDYSTRIIHESSVWDDVNYYRRQKNMHDEEIIDNFIKGRSVWTSYGSQKSYKIDDVLTNQTILSKFPNPEYKSYQDYFLKKYKINLKDPKQFLLVHKSIIKDRDQFGNVTEKINIVILPSEIVRATGIPEEERGNYQVMKAFAEYTCLPPDLRFEKINDLVSTLNKGENDEIKKVKVDPMKMVINEKANLVPGMFLPKPRIMMSKTNGSVPAKDKIDLKSLYESVPLKNWVVVYEPYMEKNLDAVIDNLVSSANRFKINMSDPTSVFLLPKSGKPADLEKDMAKAKNFTKPDIIFFLIGKRGATRIYQNMKAYYTKLGIPLQFFVSFNQNRDQKPNSKYSNLVLQMVNKLGSNLWCIDRTMAQGLVLGVATCNASKGRSITTSASQYSTNFSKIYSTSRLLNDQSKPAVGKSVGDSTVEHVRNYIKQNGKMAKNLVIYRQGTSEGQIDNVVREEVQQVVNLLQNEFGDQRPRILMAVVTKKIDDRFAVRAGGIMNPDCGLIVEDVVVKTDYANFFMVAQFVNQGSANPTHYAIVYNETEISMGDLQSLTYDLCWAYTNWMGPIKVPSPLQYANKLSQLTSITLSAEINDKIKQTAYFL